MALKQSKQVAAGAPVPSTIEANKCYAVTGEYTIATGDAAGDIIEFGGVPANATVIDLIIHHDGIGGTVDAGLISGDYAKKDNTRTIGQEFGAALATAAAGVVRLVKNTNAVAQSASEQGWGVKLLAAPTVGRVIRATLVVIPKGF
jgi:hypothetical protein